MSSTVTPAPQPTPNQNQIIETLFSVMNMAVMAMNFVPGIPGAAVTIAHDALSDMEAAYAAYTANPTADLYDEIVATVEAAMAGIKAILHP